MGILNKVSASSTSRNTIVASTVVSLAIWWLLGSKFAEPALVGESQRVVFATMFGLMAVVLIFLIRIQDFSPKSKVYIIFASILCVSMVFVFKIFSVRVSVTLSVFALGVVLSSYFEMMNDILGLD